MNTQRIALDLSKASAPTPVVRIGQGDMSGTTIVAAIYDNGAAVSLAGLTARFVMLLPGGQEYARDDCSVSGGEVTYVVDESHFAVREGMTDRAYFEIMDGDEVRYSTQRFRVQVLRSAYDGAVPGEAYDSAIEDAIADCAEAADECREVIETGIPTMSPETKGGARLGAGLEMDGGVLGLAPMAADAIGGARLGAGLEMAQDVLSVAAALRGAIANAKSLLGQLGLDGNDDPLIDAATARANLDAAQSNGAAGTLKAAEGEIDALESSLAYVESTTAKTNHAAGDYFMLGNVLMKATAAIAAGETINVSKATPATVQGQIDTLRDSVDSAVVSKGLWSGSANDIYRAGMYRCSNQSISNLPDADCILVVLPAYPRTDGLLSCAQVVISSTAVTWIRMNWPAGSKSWTDWRRVTTT